MPRIRTIKPEFWDSPSTAKASAVARLAYIAMWNWADDYGRGTANLKELEGFVFPNDDVHELSGGHARCFRDVVAEVEACFEVVFYSHDGRPYYEIPAWEQHQRNERRAKQSRHPGPFDEGSTLTPLSSDNAPSREGGAEGARNIRRAVAETPRTSGPGTGEQGNRGTGEQSSSSAKPPAVAKPPRADVEQLCTRLRDHIAGNTSKTPNITAKWRTEARLLLDRDGIPFDEAVRVLDWCQADSFWKGNILSMPKFREKFAQLQIKSHQSNVAQFPARQTASEKAQGWLNTVDEAVRLMGGNQ